MRKIYSRLRSEIERTGGPSGG